MLKSEEAVPYEICIVLEGTFLILMLQLATGPLFTWMLWALSLVIVILSFVDHVCIGWNFTFDCQMRRIGCNLLYSIFAGLILYFSVKLMMPDTEARSVGAVIVAIQKLLRVYTYYGQFLYAYYYILFYGSVLAAIRVLVNGVYLVYMMFAGEYSGGTGNHRSTDAAEHHPRLNIGQT